MHDIQGKSITIVILNIFEARNKVDFQIFEAILLRKKTSYGDNAFFWMKFFWVALKILRSSLFYVSKTFKVAIIIDSLCKSIMYSV